jgi:hypothetical protein
MRGWLAGCDASFRNALRVAGYSAVFSDRYADCQHDCRPACLLRSLLAGAWEKDGCQIPAVLPVWFKALKAQGIGRGLRGGKSDSGHKKTDFGESAFLQDRRNVSRGALRML